MRYNLGSFLFRLYREIISLLCPVIYMSLQQITEWPNIWRHELHVMRRWGTFYCTFYEAIVDIYSDFIAYNEDRRGGSLTTENKGRELTFHRYWRDQQNKVSHLITVSWLYCNISNGSKMPVCYVIKLCKTGAATVTFLWLHCDRNSELIT